jgi:hypothetical protein
MGHDQKPMRHGKRTLNKTWVNPVDFVPKYADNFSARNRQIVVLVPKIVALFRARN